MIVANTRGSRHAPFHRTRPVAWFVLFLLSSLPVSAQGLFGIDPPEVYPGENIVTIRLMSGVREVRCVPVSTTSNIRIEGVGGAPGCPTQHDLRIFIGDPGADVRLHITVIDCNNRRYVDTSVSLNTKWSVNKIRYGTVEQGVEICREFWISSEERDTWLDSVTVGDPNVRIVLPTTLPVRIRKGAIYRYQVCFMGAEQGEFDFPVITWMRRDHPWGGFTTYAVADTGGVRVVLPPTISAETSPSTRLPHRDTVRGSDPLPLAQRITDPTTFRSVVTPNAVIPLRGSLSIGSYDLLGLTLGYSVTDNLMVIVGGAPPLPDDWGGVRGESFSAWSAGLKGGMAVGPRWRVALGYQFAQSRYDKEESPAVDSRITVNIPYASVSHGDDDRRVSLTIGYALKRHVTPEEGAFDRNALFASLGGDVRVGREWKIAGEIVGMETLGVAPIIATARYFGQRWAIDAGIVFLGIETTSGSAPSIPLAPLVAVLIVF